VRLSIKGADFRVPATAVLQQELCDFPEGVEIGAVQVSNKRER
jgi:hypothetical protein